MNNVQAKKFLESIEVAIAVKKRMTFFHAERSDQAIDSFAYRVPTVAQKPVILRGLYGEVTTSSVEDMEPGQFALHLGEGRVTPDPL